jgi:hypothetical protein
MKIPDELDAALKPTARPTRDSPSRLYPGTAQIIDLARVRATRQHIRRQRQPRPLGTRVVIVASLTVGAAIGGLLGWLNASDALTQYRDGRLLARGALARALDEQIAGHAPADADVRIGATYRTHEGSYCRTFTVTATPTLIGLACRVHSRWQVQTVLANGSAAAVLLELNRNLSGAPVAAAAEPELRAHDWR